MMAAWPTTRDLAQRVRDLIGERTEATEQKMFGGLAFMVNTHMACGLIRDDLMVRVGKPTMRPRSARRRGDGVHRAPDDIHGAGSRVLRSRPTTVLERWVAEAVAFALSEPPKPPKATEDIKDLKDPEGRPVAPREAP